ncbi:hypothetical protein ABZ352_19005 [Streptomyces griseofuscus]|uniref:hypothetical protein n=1 Tax=Streptomyces griseofuscus TaxID=146922 RepID=UPI0033FE47DF
MTGFPDLYLVRARVRVAGREFTSQVPLQEAHFNDPAVRRYATGRAMAMLYHEGVLCDRCAGLLPAPPCGACAPVRTTLLLGEREYPLFEAAPTFCSPSPFRQLRVVAATRADDGQPHFATLGVPAEEWSRSGPQEWDTLVNSVVARLLSGAPEMPFRVFLWDGQREIDFPTDHLRAPADQGR